jgi:hypothetical protein
MTRLWMDPNPGVDVGSNFDKWMLPVGWQGCFHKQNFANYRF